MLTFLFQKKSKTKKEGRKTGFLITILIIAAVIFFIGLIKATVVIAYSDDIELYVKVLFLKIKILPSKEKKYSKSMSAKKAAKIRESLRKKAEKKRIAAEEKEKAKEEKKSSKEKKSIAEIIAIIKMVSDIAVTVIGKFFKHLRIKIAKIKITIATGDAATTAIAYGAVSQSLNILMPALESVKNFEKLDKADINIALDYAAEAPTIDIKLGFSIRVWHVFDLAFSALGRFIKHMLKMPKSKKSSKEADASSKNTQTKKHKF